MTQGPDPLVECVPNVSEGRRPEVIAELRSAVEAEGRVCVLDVHSDADHNRSVITFVGSPEAAEEAILRLAGAAARLIDMRIQDGVHPRLGALDVVPFVPLTGGGMDLCTTLAQRTGRRIATDLALPVFLYGNAAGKGRPTRLADLRRGGFEGLVAAQRAPLAPDYGPLAAHPTAGAVAVGSRDPLVAFNLLLDTADRGVAQGIARAVREASGGLPAVQALGLFLPSRALAQVSTNILDPGRTSLLDLVGAVRTTARAFGTRVVEAELVGLAPAAALAGLEAEDLLGLPTAADSIESRLELCAG